LAIELLKIADDLGYEWSTDHSYLEYNHWENYKEETCYWIKSGSYTDKSFYEKSIFNIINVKELLKINGRTPFKLNRK
jgi:hypothetical protein